MPSTSLKFRGELTRLKFHMKTCKSCPLHKHAKSSVPGIFINADEDIDIMFIGEAPGKDEDRQGLPFVGKAGQLLQKVLIDNDMTTNIYITNIIKHRPPNNRKPTLDEMIKCGQAYLNHEIFFLNPKAIVCLGRSPAEYLMLNSNVSKKGSLRSFTFDHDIGYTSIPVYCTWHPAYILRNESKLPELVDDLLTVKDYIHHASINSIPDSVPSGEIF